jgi:type II secretory pathway pseudopilin PulG
MLSFRRHPVSVSRRAARYSAAFTLAETCVGIVILSLVAGSLIWGLSQLNYYATASRLYTAAQTLAQNQIDQILTKAPYDPATSSYPTPNVLRTDWSPYYSDAAGNIYSTAQNVPLYTDPATGVVSVTATIATKITSPAVTINGTDLNLRQAVVTVSYKFRNKTFSIVMNTMRAPDQ